MDSTYDPRTFWERRYAAGGDSGRGSAGEEAAWKVECIVELARRLGVRSILDLGSGDGRIARSVMRALPADVAYLGVELSPAAVAHCRRHALPEMVFVEGNFTALELPPADLVLCIDVLFHLPSDAAHAAAVAAACRAFRRAAVVTAWNEAIVAEYGGRFAAHTAFRPLVAPDGIAAAETKVPACPTKSLFVLTRSQEAVP